MIYAMFDQNGKHIGYQTLPSEVWVSTTTCEGLVETLLCMGREKAVLEGHYLLPMVEDIILELPGQKRFVGIP